MPAIGYVTKQVNGGFKGQLKTLAIRAEIDLVPNAAKSADSQPDFRVVTQGVEIGAGWVRKGETSGKDYVSLSLAAPEFGPRKLSANLGRAAGQDVVAARLSREELAEALGVTNTDLVRPTKE